MDFRLLHFRVPSTVAATLALLPLTIMTLGHAAAGQSCDGLGEAFDAPVKVTQVNKDSVQLYAHPKKGGKLGKFDRATLEQARVDCRASNLMLHVVLPGGESGWVFGKTLKIDQTISLSSGCPSKKEVRLGATRGSSGDCG